MKTTVTTFAQQTGDYAVLSKPDLAVLALTYAMDVEQSGSSDALNEKAPRAQVVEQTKPAESSASTSETTTTTAAAPSVVKSPWAKVEAVNHTHDENGTDGKEDGQTADFPPLRAEQPDVEESASAVKPSSDVVNAVTSKVSQLKMGEAPAQQPSKEDAAKEKRINELKRQMEEENKPFEQVYAEDDQDEPGWTAAAGEDDDAGEWITPSNVGKHKATDLGLLPVSDATGKDGKPKRMRKRGKGMKERPQIGVACYTGDYAVQNVLLQMGLGLVGEGGKRIREVKSWVLRCHACFK